VGSSARNAVASHLALALLHDVKAETWPLSWDVSLWRAEARTCGSATRIRSRLPHHAVQRLSSSPRCAGNSSRSAIHTASDQLPSRDDPIPPNSLDRPDRLARTLTEPRTHQRLSLRATIASRATFFRRVGVAAAICYLL
jgi:hypothetical protein